MYVKTAKGQEEIQSRTYKLPFNLRKLLIMVDGHSTTGEIIERLTALGHTALLGNMIPAFVELEAGEFIAFCTSPTSQTAPASNAAGGALSAASLAEQATAPPFNLDKAKNFTRSILLSTLDPSAGQQIERIEATATAEELRTELDAVHEMLPKVLSKRQAEQVWKHLEPIMQPLTENARSTASASPKIAPVTSPAVPQFNLDKAKHLIRFTLLGAMGPSAERRIERVEAAATPEALRAELEAIYIMLPKVLSKRQAEQVWKQFEPIMLSILLPPT
ncbi:MAG: hypothetical protein KDI50_07810 [Candidatus Competibacteraceae bacterium]|nr:hypothetical protein [Candidatus Competibacteraceae bacterium]